MHETTKMFKILQNLFEIVSGEAIGIFAEQEYISDVLAGSAFIVLTGKGYPDRTHPSRSPRLPECSNSQNVELAV